MHEGVAGTSAPTEVCVVHLFGRARIEIEGTELVVRGPIKRGLMAMLALDLGRSVHADRLVDGLWEESATWDVLQSLRVHISQLRTSLERHVTGSRQFIEGRYPLYRFSDQVTTDFARASALRDRALDQLAGDPRAALLDLEAARRLVAEDPLAEVLHLPFAQFAVEPLRAFQLQLAEDYTEVAAAVWGMGDPDGTEPRVRPASMDERRWRLFTRLVDAPTGVAPAPASTSGSAGVRQRDDVLARERPPTTVPSGLASRIPPRCVGRQRERAQLLDLQRAVQRERKTRVVQIVGPGGVGKTSLAATIAQDLAASGTDVIYASWSGAALAGHAPLFAAGLIRTPAQDQTNPPLGQDALAAEIIDGLRARHDCCLALVLDDVHQMPERYHSVIGRLLAAPDLAVLAVLLARPGPETRGLDDLLPPDTQRMRLRPFADHELDELGSALAVPSAPATGRNLPWVAGLLLTAQGDSTDNTIDDRIGDAVEQVVGADRELLEHLALAPDGLMLRTLQHGTELTPIETLERLRGLVSDGLVTEMSTRPPRFVIAHELIGDAVRDRAGVATCIRRAASLHDALVATEAPLGERVRSAILGADLLHGRAEETVTAAAKLHLRHGAFADAIELANAAQDAGVTRSASARIMVDGSKVFAQAALGERNDGATRLLDLAHDAVDIAEWDLVVTLMQWRSRFGIADTVGGPVLEAALAAVDAGEPRLRFEILWGLVFQIMFRNGRVAEASPLVDEMVEIANDLRDPATRTRALACRHWLLAVMGASAEEMDEISDAIARYADETNDEQLIAVAYAGQVGDALRRHDLDAVDRHAEVLRGARDPHTRWRSRLVDAMLQLDRVDLDGAEATIGDASSFAREHGLIIRGDEAIAQAFVLAWARGTLGQFRELLEVRDPNSPGFVAWSAALALARLAAGDRPGAVALGEELAATAHSISDWDWYAFVGAALLADVAFFTDSHSVADHVIEQLTPLSGRRVLLGLAVDLGPVDRYLALAHGTVGARTESQELRSRARVQAGCELWSQRIEHDEAAVGDIIPATGGAWSWIAAR